MSRLIDADAFKERIGTETKIREMLCKAIDEEPTAYDLEKSIEQLEEYKYSHLVERKSERLKHCEEQEDEYCKTIDCFWCVWNRAMEIVKGGAKCD